MRTNRIAESSSDPGSESPCRMSALRSVTSASIAATSSALNGWYSTSTRYPSSASCRSDPTGAIRTSNAPSGTPSPVRCEPVRQSSSRTVVASMPARSSCSSRPDATSRAGSSPVEVMKTADPSACSATAEVTARTVRSKGPEGLGADHCSSPIVRARTTAGPASAVVTRDLADTGSARSSAATEIAMHTTTVDRCPTIR